MAKKETGDIGVGSSLYIEEARGRHNQAAPIQPKPKPAPGPAPAEFKFIGKSTARIDGRKIVTGQAKYTHDVRLRGMLAGKILRSPQWPRRCCSPRGTNRTRARRAGSRSGRRG
jgi:hypothetical protein